MIKLNLILVKVDWSKGLVRLFAVDEFPSLSQTDTQSYSSWLWKFKHYVTENDI